jgi:UDP-GlcNAc:undecaprenyl-phosphate/decaprenyl-phosphate GlcNAc-1-phosphate transferase
MKSSKRLGLIDAPNSRSMHVNEIPRGAGVGFVGAVLLATVLFDCHHLRDYLYLYASIFIVFLVGFADDIYDTSPKMKFIFILVAVSLLFYNDLYIKGLGTYFGYDVPMLPLVAFIFTFIAVSGFTNALNLIDGLDGLAALISMVILSTFVAIGIMYDDSLLVTLPSLLMTSLAAFLVFNWNPARVFMGDSGSLTLGFIIAVMAVRALDYIEPSAVLFLAAIPILDTLVVSVRRIQRKVSPFKADKNHLHHLMFRMKGEVKHVVILLVYIQMAFSIIGMQMLHAENTLSIILFGILFLFSSILRIPG